MTIERGDAVNLARNIIENELPLSQVKELGIAGLADAVLRMDAYIRSTEDASSERVDKTLRKVRELLVPLMHSEDRYATEAIALIDATLP